MTGVELTVVGCSGSLPGPDSPASCYLVTAPGPADGGGTRSWRLALDLGNGAVGALHRHADPASLDAVLLSHLHPDHCLDLVSLDVLLKHRPGSPTGRIPVHAPAGAAERLGRAAGVTGPEDLTGSYAFTDLTDGATFTVGPFTVTPVAVAHSVESYGFRVEADGAVLAYTGDTDSCPALEDLMTGADLVLADCAYVDGRDATRGIHLTGSRAAQAAVDAGGVRRLVLTHLSPWNDPDVCRAQAAAVWSGGVEVAAAGRTWRLG